MALKKTSDMANKGVKCPLVDPVTQLPNGIRFIVLGSDSKLYQQIIRQHETERLEKQKKYRGIYFPTPEENEAKGLDLLVRLTIGWEEDVCNEEGKVVETRKEIELDEGKLIPFSPEAVSEFYAELGYKCYREQVDAFIGDRRNFLPNAN